MNASGGPPPTPDRSVSLTARTTIVIADKSTSYDGRDLERRPLGGTESSVIRLARALAARGHDVTCFTACTDPVEDGGVRWRPLGEGLPEHCDLYLAVHQTELLGLVRRPRRLALWVISPARQLAHHKRFLTQWRYRPIPVFASLNEARSYAWWLPRHDPRIVLPLGLPDDIRGLPPLDRPPPPRAIFASNPHRNLKRLVEIWVEKVAPRVPGAVLDVYGLNGLGEGTDPWRELPDATLPQDLSAEQKATVAIHPPTSREALMRAMRGSRAMLYLGHKSEAFCLALAEAQALGVPAVVAPTKALPERVIDGVTGHVRGDAAGFAEATVALLSDDRLWRRQHESALALRQGLSWDEVAARLEYALLSDRIPTDWPLGMLPGDARTMPLLGAPNDLV